MHCCHIHPRSPVGSPSGSQHMSTLCPPSINCSWTLQNPCPTSASQMDMWAPVDAHRKQLLHCCCDAPVPARGGKLCDTERCTAEHREASSHGNCPRYLLDTWNTLPGFSEATNLAMACRADGGWLAPGVEKFRKMYYGVNRNASFRVTKRF